MNKDILSQSLADITRRTITWTTDQWGNSFGWLRLKHPGIIIEVAKYLAGQQARLCTMTAFADKRSDVHKRRSLAYHFTVNSLVLTITTPLYDLTTYEPLPVSSITPWFRNADWNEREFHEMFNIQVVGHPNPKRLFLDERLDTGIMEQLIPFSAMVHGASTTALWEKVMAAKAAGAIDDGREAVIAARKAEDEALFHDHAIIPNFPVETESLAKVDLTDTPKNPAASVNDSTLAKLTSTAEEGVHTAQKSKSGKTKESSESEA